MAELNESTDAPVPQDETPRHFSDAFSPEALDKLNDENRAYLGDPQAVESLLKNEAAIVLGALHQPDFDHVIDLAGKRVAKAILGQDPKWHKVDGWNEPGGVDESIAKWYGSYGPDAETRISGVFHGLIAELVEIMAYSQTPGVPPENWNYQPEAAFQSLAMSLIGVSPAQQALL